jgi:hypothetical protein
MSGTNDEQSSLIWLFCDALEIGEDALIAVVPGCHPVNT